jgi:hypothetical protein
MQGDPPLARRLLKLSMPVMGWGRPRPGSDLSITTPFSPMRMTRGREASRDAPPV